MSAPATRESVAVLVVGGGPVGLTASALLSQQGLRNLVVERRGALQRAPAAHVLRPRSMQVFARIGVADAIERAKPVLALDFVSWCATLGGTLVGKLDLRAGLPEGAEAWTNCPQNRLEPILLDRARSEPKAQVLRGAECVAVGQDRRGVHAEVALADGTRRSVRARWMIAADGAASAVRRMLAIPMVGPGPQGRFFMLHFEADLRPLMKDREGPLFWILNPAAQGTIIVHDPARQHVFMSLRFGTEGEERALPARLAAALGAELPTRILSVDSWSPHVQVASRYREGRVFLAGDAAHRFPPTGGLGLNTGILDVDFLVHQLARVESGRAGPETLDRYELECRPVAEQNASLSFENLKRLGDVHRAIGPCADLAALEARVASLGPAERRQLDRAIENQRSHFLSDGRLPRDPRAPESAAAPLDAART